MLNPFIFYKRCAEHTEVKEVKIFFFVLKCVETNNNEIGILNKNEMTL